MLTLSRNGAAYGPLEFESVDAARDAATRDAAATGRRVYSVVVAEQGGRRQVTTQLPLKVLSRLAECDSAPRGGDPGAHVNRPLMEDHVRAIKGYLVENRGAYILPPVTLATRQPMQLYVQGGDAAVRIGYLVVGDEVEFQLVDGQHRFAAIAGYTNDKGVHVPGVLRECPDLGSDGISLVIVYEPDLYRMHQDFADAARTKPIPASLLAEYNMREPLNRVMRQIVKDSPLLDRRIDSVSTKLPKHSPAVFLLNQVRQFVKELLVRDYGMAEDQLAKQAQALLGTEAQRAEFVQRALELLRVLTEEMPAWTEVATLPTDGAAANGVAKLRDTWLSLTAPGLNVIGRLGWEISQKSEPERIALYRRLATEIPWKRIPDPDDEPGFWEGSIVQGGKLQTHRRAITDGAVRVMARLGLTPQ